MFAARGKIGAAMGFGEAIATCFRKFVTFSGRARRSEYWYFYLFCALGGFGAGILDGFIGGAAQTASRTGPVAAVFQLAVLLPSLSVQVRRLHDTNRSGWLLLG